MLERSLIGLRALKYLNEDTLSEKGVWASNLCTNLVIELAEIVEKDLLDISEPEKIVSTIASIAGDSYRQYLKAPKGFLKKETKESLKEILDLVQKHSMPGVREDLEVVEDAAFTVVTWMRSTNWQSFRSLLLLSGVAEGDAARLITQTGEQLNQIARLNQTHQKLADVCEEARLQLLRPPLREVMSLDVSSS